MVNDIRLLYMTSHDVLCEQVTFLFQKPYVKSSPRIDPSMTA